MSWESRRQCKRLEKKNVATKEKVNSVRLRGTHQFERGMGKEKVGEEDRQRWWWQDESPAGSNDVGADDEQNE